MAEGKEERFAELLRGIVKSVQETEQGETLSYRIARGMEPSELAPRGRHRKRADKGLLGQPISS